MSGEQNTSNGSRPMAPNERRGDDGRGGVSTITRPGARQRPARSGVPPQRAERAAGRWHATVPERAAGAVPNAAAGAVPNAQAIPNVRTAPQPGASRVAAPAFSSSGAHRLPFVLLLFGMLGGALVSALVISTTLAAGSFEITKLQNSTIAQTRQLQSLEEQVAQAQSEPQIATRAAELGMRPLGELRFVDLKTGKITTDGANWAGEVPAGYTP